jgi:transposase
VIRIDAVWMATEPLDMRAGADTALARVVQVFGAAHPHHAYLFANQRANRMKVLVHDGVGVWLAARRLNTGKFVWGDARLSPRLPMNAAQLNALALGLPWQRMGDAGVITVL